MLLKHSTISVIETKHWPFSAKHCISVNTSYRGHVVTWSQNGSAQKKRSIRHSNWFPDSTSPRFKSWVDVVFLGKMSWANLFYSYGHLSVITGYFSGIIHSINGVLLVLITGISGHNCSYSTWVILWVIAIPHAAGRWSGWTFVAGLLSSGGEPNE